MVGSALVRALRAEGFGELVLRSRSELNLLDQAAVERFFREEKIDIVFLAAGKVGGILANRDFQADFLYENLAIVSNIIHSAATHGVRKLVNFGSSCIYPKHAPQPIEEGHLLTGPLEPTNEGYAIAKIAGLKLCETYRKQHGKDFVSLMPTNLYGPGDNFHPTGSHVIPGLMRRFHEAKEAGLAEVAIWGTGSARREFMHVDDLASAALLVMRSDTTHNLINAGVGTDITILEVARLIREVVGYSGKILTDPTKPDGTPRKLLNVDRLKSLGFSPKIELRDGLAATYKWALAQRAFSGQRKAA